MNNQPSVLQVLFPHLADVEIDYIVRVGRAVRIRAHARATAAACPACGTSSRRVHARYVRRLADRAVGGQETSIDLAVRRFVCGQRDCPKKTFAEQVGGLTVRHGRRSLALQHLLAQVGLALGGRPGARLTRHLAAEVSAATLLRLVRVLPPPPVGEVKVLGVDEFAFRRGRRYGAILLDMDTHRPVDVLPDRTSDTLARWLQAHPSVEIVCRDRAGSFADGADRGIPGVGQVADRWHLLNNLADAVEQAVIRHRACLREPQPEPEPPRLAPAPVVDEPPRAPKVRALHAEVHALLARGVNLTTIAQTLGRDPKTVRRYARAATAEQLLGPTVGRTSMLDPHKPYLASRYAAGCSNAATLCAELRERGYKGGRKTVRRFLNTLADQAGPLPPPPPPPPAVREVVRWIIGRPDRRSEDERQQLKNLAARCAVIAEVAELASTFAGLLRRRQGDRLPAWLAQVDASDIKELHSFANGLRKDLDAVTAGLTQPWNSGAVEGQVTRIKMLKRQGYGRASFDLLRQRILLSP